MTNWQAGNGLALANDKKQHATHALTFVFQANDHLTISNNKQQECKHAHFLLYM
jgi:hypothetical protein